MKNNKKEKNNKKDSSAIENIASKLNLPEDVLLGATIVTINGNRELNVENYRGLAEYDDNKIVVQGKKCMIVVEGQKLKIEYFSNVDMKIKGLIKSVEYK